MNKGKILSAALLGAFLTAGSARALDVGSGEWLYVPISGSVECLDFDLKSEALPAWVKMVEKENPGLLDKLVREQSSSGG